ncbi:MAG: hypothetical protein AB1689_06300 [Thermodesulfobacteriota bacterium]
MSERAREQSVDSVVVPAPTAWPLLAALGVTLVFAGLVTHVFATVVGAVLFVVCAVGWFRSVLPEEETEIVPLRPPARRAREVVPTPHKVEHLEPGGAEAHRMRLPLEIHPYSAGIRGGIVGGVVMALLACVFGLIDQRSVWYPINLVAAAALPSLAEAGTGQLKQFHAWGLVLAVVVHGSMSLLVGLLYAMILPMLPRLPILLGGVVAPLLWTALVWASLGVINPALNERIHWGWFVASQIGFGVVAGIVIARTERIRTLQALPLAMRMGIEGGRGEDEGERR